jgi:alkylhydroperoxidase/carboxymuconolactone decarboxylase family protein YurZ
MSAAAARGSRDARPFSTSSCARLVRLATETAGPPPSRGARVDSGHCHLDPRARALVGVGALLATGGGQAAFDHHVSHALAAGITTDELIAALIEVAPTLGMAQLVAVTVELARALGYDVDEALERFDDPPSSAPAGAEL